MRAMAMEDAEHEMMFGYGDQGAAFASASGAPAAKQQKVDAPAPAPAAASPGAVSDFLSVAVDVAKDDGVADAPGAAPIPAFPVAPEYELPEDVPLPPLSALQSP